MRYRDQNGAVGCATSGLDSTTITPIVYEKQLGPPATPPHTPREKQPDAAVAYAASAACAVDAADTYAAIANATDAACADAAAVACHSLSKPERSGGQIDVCLKLDDHSADGRAGVAWVASDSAVYAV